jgi:hypothetical protein
MSGNYFIVMALFLIGCAIAMRIGWLSGIQFASNQFTKERADAVDEEIRQKYYAHIEKEFKMAVENRAREIVDECFAKIEEQEKENENEGSGSN